MAINYQKKEWKAGVDYFTPSDFNRAENGIKSACDGVDRHDTELDVVRASVDSTNLSVTELKLLGYTVPTEMSVKNYVDSNRVFHQKVGRVCLGSLNWSYDSGGSLFISSSISDILDHDMTTTGKEYCFGYTYAPVSSSQMGNLTFRKAGLNNKTFYFKNSSYTDASAFKSAMADTYLYYELATPVTKNVYDRNYFDLLIDTNALDTE